MRNDRCVFASLVLTLACSATTTHAATYSGGDGSDGNPYKISNVQDILDLSDPANAAGWDKHFHMTAARNFVDGLGRLGYN
jgi:hypothetical protein